MIASRQPSRSIVLTGFYGCGSLDVGRELARRLRRQLIDWGSEVERRGRRDLLHLLNLGPEPDRGLQELRVASELAYRRDSVIVLEPQAVELDVWPELYLDNTLTVFIDQPFELLWQRMQGDPQSREYVMAHSKQQAFDNWARLYPRFEYASLRLINTPNPPRQARVILHSFYT